MVRRKEVPLDTFYYFTNYLENNFEALRDATRDLYGYKPDIEWAINIYKTVADNEEAKKYIDENRENTLLDLLSVQHGSWTYMGAFKENRERIDFYNKNTQILEQMIKLNAEEKKLGAELTRKKANINKLENERRAKEREANANDEKAEPIVSSAPQPPPAFKGNPDIVRCMSMEPDEIRRLPVEFFHVPENYDAQRYIENVAQTRTDPISIRDRNGITLELDESLIPDGTIAIDTINVSATQNTIDINKILIPEELPEPNSISITRG
jgi:hypothetical protein